MKQPKKAIYALLSGLAGGRVYASRAPQNCTLPYVVYQNEQGERWRDIDGPTGWAQSTYEITFFDATAYGAQALADAAEAILDGYDGIVTYGTPEETINICASLQYDADALPESDDPPVFAVQTGYLITYQQ